MTWPNSRRGENCSVKLSLPYKPMRDQYTNECKQIKQNAEYTAEAHHIIAGRFKRQAFWLQLIPAIVAAGTSTLVAGGFAPSSLLLLTVISSVVTAVANVIGPRQKSDEHRAAAVNFTLMKHESRALHETFSVRMSDEVFAGQVELLHKHYNSLVRISPQTDEEAFTQAQQRIQKGIHDPDRDPAGNIR